MRTRRNSPSGESSKRTGGWCSSGGRASDGFFVLTTVLASSGEPRKVQRNRKLPASDGGALVSASIRAQTSDSFLSLVRNASGVRQSSLFLDGMRVAVWSEGE